MNISADIPNSITLNHACLKDFLGLLVWEMMESETEGTNMLANPL